MKKNWKRKSALALSGVLLLGGSLTVSAEEVTPAGYHVYDVQEEEASDTWYGIERGAYLRAGVAKITHGDTGYALGSGTTFAHYSCDRVYVRIYLDESEDASNDSWGTLDYWTGISYDNSTATTQSGPYKITSGNYYRITGAHSVTQDDYTEATTTCTDALRF